MFDTNDYEGQLGVPGETEDRGGGCGGGYGSHEWVGSVARRYTSAKRPDLGAVALHAAKYLACRGGLNDHQRDEIILMVMLAAGGEAGVIEKPENWGRSVAKRRLLEFRREERGGFASDEEHAEWWAEKLIEDEESLKLAVRRKCEAEAGNPDLEEVMSWGEAEPLDEFVTRHAGEVARRIAVRAILRGYWPGGADFEKHSPSDVVENLYRHVLKILKKVHR